MGKTITVLPIVFNQFEKDWVAKPFRSLFPQFSPKMARFLLEFDYLVINLASLPDEIMASLDEYGTLKASLLAMKHVRNKRFLNKHFKEIFLFLQLHPEKIDLRDQLITYVLGQSDVSVEDLQDLLHNIFSPTITEEMVYTGNGFIAVAYREAAARERERLEKKAEKVAKATKIALEKAKIAVRAEARAEAHAEAEKARIFTNRLTVARSWHKGFTADTIAAIVDLPQNEISTLIASFEDTKQLFEANPNADFEEFKAMSKLDEAELTALLALLKRK